MSQPVRMGGFGPVRMDWWFFEYEVRNSGTPHGLRKLKGPDGISLHAVESVMMGAGPKDLCLP